MDEASFWSSRIRPMVSAFGYAERIENGLASGTPDVHYVLRVDQLGRFYDVARAGWIENKYRENAPMRASSIVFGLKGLRKEQIAWWLCYLAKGGRGAICAGIGRSSWIWKATPLFVRTFNDMTWEQVTMYEPISHGAIERALS